MNTQQDFEELLLLLRKNNVDFIIVGGYAVAFHGYPRYTKDIDLFYNNSDRNIDNLYKSLLDFGFPSEDLPKEVFKEEDKIIQFGLPPLRIDLLNKIDGVTYQEVSNSKVGSKYGKANVFFIGKKELIKNKRHSARTQDLLDVEKLDT